MEKVIAEAKENVKKFEKLVRDTIIIIQLPFSGNFTSLSLSWRNSRLRSLTKR